MQTIIVATDFSKTAANATEYAVELAKYFSAKLVLLNVCTLPEGDFGSMTTAELKGIIEKRSLDRLKGLEKKIKEGSSRKLSIETYASEGKPEEVIKEAAAQFKADLVVMGVTDDIGFVNEFVLKSTSIETAKATEVYTLLVPETAKYHKVRKMALACDLDHTEDTAVPYVAKYFCKSFGAELEIINVNPDGNHLPADKAGTLEFIDNKLQTVMHSTVILKGSSPKRDLRSYFETSDSDILMIMPKKHNFLYYLFDRSVTNNLAGKIKMPVLIIH